MEEDTYAAPELFPGLSSGHEPLVDIWLLGIIVFKWIYGILNPPDVPKPKTKNGEVSAHIYTIGLTYGPSCSSTSWRIKKTAR